MQRIDPGKPIEPQIVTGEKEEDIESDSGPADTFYDAWNDQIFTIPKWPDDGSTVELKVYWADNKDVEVQTFCGRIASRRYGLVDRDTAWNIHELEKAFLNLAFDELQEKYGLDQQIDELGATLRDARVAMLISSGPSLSK